LRRFLRSEEANVTVEFVLLFPLFILILISVVEIGTLMTRNTMLGRGLDLAVRDLRLGLPVARDFDAFRQRVCDAATIIPDCLEVLQVELMPASTGNLTPLSDETRCINREDRIAPINATNYVVGGENELMMIRACALFDPIVPTMGLALLLPVDSTGAYALIATSAFVNEPAE
jgi:Flp pilus assembly protein TadG